MIKQVILTIAAISSLASAAQADSWHRWNNASGIQLDDLVDEVSPSDLTAIKFWGHDFTDSGRSADLFLDDTDSFVWNHARGTWFEASYNNCKDHINAGTWADRGPACIVVAYAEVFDDLNYRDVVEVAEAYINEGYSGKDVVKLYNNSFREGVVLDDGTERGAGNRHISRR